MQSDQKKPGQLVKWTIFSRPLYVDLVSSKHIDKNGYYQEIEFRRYDAGFLAVKSTSLGFILWEFLNVRINFGDWSKQPMGMEDQYMTNILC